MPSAGAYKKEIDLSLYTEVASDFKVALVDVFNKGPLNTRTLVTNLPMLLDTFGKPINHATHSQGFLAAREYLRKGNQLHIVRSESTATAAVAGTAGLQGTTDESHAANTDGISTIATGNFSSATSTFQTDNVEVGDVLEITGGVGGGDVGFYHIKTISTENAIIVEESFPAGDTAVIFKVYTSMRWYAAAGATSVPATRTLTLAGAKFTNGVKVGDILHIDDTTAGPPDMTLDNGHYVITEVTSDTVVVVNRDWPAGSLTALDFTIYGSNHPDAADGVTGTGATIRQFSSAAGQFVKHAVAVGDLLVIEDVGDTGDNGTYLIATVTNLTTLQVNRDFPEGSLATLTYKIMPGSAILTGKTKGLWCDDYDTKVRCNSYDSSKFDVLTYDENNFLLETVFSTSLTTLVADMLASSVYFTAALVSSRDGPGLEYTGVVAGGDDGYTGIVDADYIGSGVSKGMDLFSNIEEIEIDCIVCPGKTSQNVGDGLVALAEYRGDCLAIPDPPVFATVATPSDSIDWHNGTGALGRTSAFNTSYGALYWSWGTTYDSWNDVTRESAPSGHALAVIANTWNVSHPWRAPAGPKRGKVPGASDVKYSPDQGERDAMQLSTNCVNPIVNFVKEGITVYGQKTLLKTSSALNRISVRFMLFYLERKMLEVAKNQSFEPNDATLWRELVRQLEPLCEYVQANRGLNDFLVLCDKTTNTSAVIEANKVIAKVFVKPTKTAEIVELQFIITAQSVDFAELLAA